ncbi:methyltransferase [Polyangium spumosum]|uniref:Methyltransferase domain-containing protein n=1 Tax=Polyangium spumosum TaxID=889282 RepID=A0A6N7PN42_9BACT|nr:methyltransferase [Polyangium spumosum]MRG91564.1 methyltransferase domain-containing protein [Polyangium spumosum]
MTTEWQRIRVAEDGTHHVVAGEPLYDARFDEVLAFHAPGLAPVRRDGEAFHVDVRGRPAYGRRFERTFGFYEGRAAVRGSDGWRHVLPDGTDLYPERYAWCGNYQQGRSAFRDMRGRYGHLDPDGRLISTTLWRYAGDFREGSAVVQADDGRSSHVRADGTLLHGRWFVDLDVFHKGFARARDGAGWMHVDRQGRAIYTRRFAAVEPFYNGQARVERHDGGLEVIDERGDPIVELRPARTSELAALSADLVGHWRTDTLAAAVSLGVFDVLPGAEGFVAERCRMPLDKTRRLLRALAELGVVTRRDDGTWASTPQGTFLRADHPLTLAGAALEYAGPLRQRWTSLETALRAEVFRPDDIFREVSSSPERCRAHHRMLESYARHDYEPLVDHLPIRAGDVVVDAGGGTGALASFIVAKHPSSRVVVLDLPGVPAAAIEPPPHLAFVETNLFDPWPVSADLIVLARVLHDWDDVHAIRLLIHARNALKPGGRIAIVEMVLDEDGHGGGLCDLHLLAVTGGRERTRRDFERILDAAGLRLVQERTTPSLPRVLVAVPA